MALTIESLKGLYEKLGGTNFGDVTTIPEAIDKVSEVAEGGGGGSLPTPGAAGNVLTSNGTAWESAAPNEFVVTAELVPGMGTASFTGLSAEYDDILDALLAGKLVRFYADYRSEQLNVAIDVPLSFGADATNQIIGLGIINNSGVLMMCRLIIAVEDDATVAVAEFMPFLPAASALDNGKILGVDNGAYALIDSKATLIVNGTWADGEGGNPNTVTITTPLADIYAAASAGRAVFLEYTEDGVTTRMGLATYENDNGAYALGFSLSSAMSDKPAVATVAFDNSLVGVFGIAVGQ